MKKTILALGAAFVLIACGGPNNDERQAEIESWLIANGTPAETAACVAIGTVDRFSVADFEDRQAADGNANLDEDDEANLDAILEVVNEKCSR